MLIVAVVGDHGSGKATFLGLLYAAMVRAGSDKADQARFRVAYDSMDEIAALYERLMSGAFPDIATKEGIHELRLELGLPRARRGLLPRLGSRKWAEDGSETVRFVLPGSLDEATPGLHQGSTFGTGSWRDPLDADALVVLVDSSKLSPKAEGPPSKPTAAFDDRLESLLTAIRRWRSRGGREVIHPMFVFSKFDAIPRAVVRAAGIEPTAPPVSKEGPRSAYARALLEPNLPRTLTTLQEAVKGRPRFASPSYFFTSVRTDAGVSGSPEKIRLRRGENVAAEIDYSREEYLAFLEKIAKIAAASTA